MDEVEKSKPTDKPDPYSIPCPICGGAEFEWGTTGPRAVKFQNDKDAVNILRDYSKPMKARECVNCGNVQLFTTWKG